MMKALFPAVFFIGAVVLTGCKDSDVTSYQVPKTESQPAASTAPALPAAPTTAEASMAQTPVPTASGEVSYTVPDGWQPMPNTPMRKGGWVIENPSGRSELTLTAFPGDVGGPLANVNRWRGQIGLGPISDLSGVTLTETAIGSGQVGQVVMLDGPNGQATRALMLSHGGSTWFVKLTGAAAVVQENVSAFDSFVRSLKL